MQQSKKQQNDEFFNIPMLHLSTNFHKNISAWKLVPKCANRQKSDKNITSLTEVNTQFALKSL